MESSSKEASAPWRPRKHVLVGMGVILGLNALTVITSIILRPAHISFSAADFYLSPASDCTSRCLPVQDKDSSVFIFNLTSHNPSSRAGLVYNYISVSIRLKHNMHPSVRETSVPASVHQEDWMRCKGQKRNSNNTMGVDAFLDSEFYNFYRKNASATIMVFAQARFKIWLAPTRLYNIRVSCQEVDLLPVSTGNHSGIAYCSEV